jgi:hypothetical protein
LGGRAAIAGFLEITRNCGMHRFERQLPAFRAAPRADHMDAKAGAHRIWAQAIRRQGKQRVLERSHHLARLDLAEIAALFAR